MEEAAPHRKQPSEVTSNFLLTKHKELIFILLNLILAFDIVDHLSLIHISEPTRLEC